MAALSNWIARKYESAPSIGIFILGDVCVCVCDGWWHLSISIALASILCIFCFHFSASAFGRGQIIFEWHDLNKIVNCVCCVATTLRKQSSFFCGSPQLTVVRNLVLSSPEYPTVVRLCVRVLHTHKHTKALECEWQRVTSWRGDHSAAVSLSCCCKKKKRQSWRRKGKDVLSNKTTCYE